MARTIFKWLIIISALINFGYMGFDGGRALVSGDYFRPVSGEYAGQLGPWSGIVEFMGVDPESTAMKFIFLLWGILGLSITLCFAMEMPWSHTAMLIISIGTLWYLIPGTILSILQIILLILFKRSLK